MKKFILIIMLLLLTSITEAGSLDWARLTIEYPSNIDLSQVRGHRIQCGTSSGNYTISVDVPMPSLVLPVKGVLPTTGTYYCRSRSYFDGGVLNRTSSNEASFFLDYRIPEKPNLTRFKKLQNNMRREV